jgi:coproporphyrinogen III oxidase
LKPNYVLAREVLYEDLEDEDYDDEFEEMQELGNTLQDKYPTIVHTYPN